MALDPIPDPRKAVKVPEVDPEASWQPYRAPLQPGQHPHTPANGFKVVGKPRPLIDGLAKVAGEAVYADDLQMPDMLVAKLIYSDVAHGRIVKVHTEAARKIPGVVDILTGEDVGARHFGVLPLTKDEEPFATDRVRFIGDIVGLVAAESEWAAIQAVRACKLEVEPLPTHFDPKKGLKEVAAKIHPGIGIDGSNVQKHVDQDFGDVEAGFRGSAVRVKHHFKFKGVHHAFTEPHAVVAHHRPDGRLTVWSATQVPHYVHRALHEVTGLPMHRIQVIRPHVGGGFGGKSDPFPHEMAVALMAMKTRRPVKLLMDREHSFLVGRGRHPTETDMEVAFDRDGHLQALDIEAVIDGGAFASFGIISTYYNGVLSMGPYKVPAFRYKGRRVYTNHIPSGAMRGHGAVNSRCAIEVLFDEAAEQLGVDPFDLRLRNMMPSYSYTINDFRITSNGLPECLARARERSGWESKFRRLPLGKGIGLGCGFYISGSNLPIHWDVKDFPQSTVHIKIDMDGGVTVHTGASEIGQGSDTVAAVCVAEVLGIDVGRVRVYSGNSDTAPVDLGSYSSRVTFMMGNAARKAAEEVARELRQAASDLTGYPPEQFVFENEHVVNAANPDARITFDEAVRKALGRKGAIAARGAFVQTAIGGRFKGATAGLAPAYSMSAYVAEVDVDLDTGWWRCTKVWAAHDCGKALNPLAVEGQIQGSVHMGLGQVQSESIEYQFGNMRNPNLLDYKIPTSLEMPEVEAIIVESNDAEGPFGAKEAGEGPLLPILPAVLNALYDAVGIRLYELPATQDKVWAAMRRQGGPKKPGLPKPRQVAAAPPRQEVR